jgi:hypothetical protein
MKNLTVADVTAVDTDAFKRAVHLLESETDDDALIDDLIKVASATVDTATAMPADAARFQFNVPAQPWAGWCFPIRPVSDLESIEVRGADGEWSAFDITGIFVLKSNDEPQLMSTPDLRSAMSDAIEVRVTAVAGGCLTDQRNQAVILLVKEWRDAGFSAEAAEVAKLTLGPERLIKQVRYVRPFEVI